MLLQSSITGWLPVWQRNFLVWRKLALPSILGNLADPLIYMLGLGYGLGAMLPSIEGQPYVAFLAAGTVCASTMNAATFEALYSAFSRMHVQKTWEAILNTPLGLGDVVAGELFWAATKSLFSGAAILAVITGMGLTNGPLMLWALPAIVLTGLAFAALGLIWNALSPSYDFFMYYFTLFITPMTLISGVFFPTDQLPGWLALIGGWLPLAQGVALIRPLLAGQVPANALIHIMALLGTAAVAFAIALHLTRRRLLKQTKQNSLMETLLVITNCPDEEIANAIALTVVEAKLAACVNILPRVQSIFRWQGVVESAAEIPLFIKTTSANYPALEAKIRQLHPYEVPEIIALPVSHGLPAYLNWVAAETEK